MIYLDNNATTQPSERAIEALTSAMRTTWANPSSVHRLGMEAKRALEAARAQFATLLGARARSIVFTGSGTESIAMALRGTLLAHKDTGRDTIITTRVEHAAIRDLAQSLQKEGAGHVRFAHVDPQGRIDPDSIADLIDDRTALVSAQWVNNETGTIQNIEAIGALCAKHNIPFHCDATQRVGKAPVNLHSDDPALGSTISLLSCAPHKFHGPKGLGILYTRPGTRLVPTTPGSQELGRRGGTEPVPTIAAAGAAAQEAHEWLQDEAPRTELEHLRNHLEHSVIERCAEFIPSGLTINSADAPRIWNTTNIAFTRLEAEALLLALSERGLCASAGAACSSGSLDPSPVLLEMGLPEPSAHGSVRFSLSKHTTKDDIDQAIDIITDAVRVVSRSMP